MLRVVAGKQNVDLFEGKPPCQSELTLHSEEAWELQRMSKPSAMMTLVERNGSHDSLLTDNYSSGFRRSPRYRRSDFGQGDGDSSFIGGYGRLYQPHDNGVDS